MAWLDFLKHGNELAELLIEGQNPYSASLLQAADVAPLQGHLPAADRVTAYVLGRVVGAGRGLWVLTDRHLLMAEQGAGDPVQVLALDSISQAECQRGKYGYTLRVTAAGRCQSVYGASPALAAAFYQALGSSVACAPIFKPPHLDADDRAQAAHHFKHAAALMQPAHHAAAHTIA